MVYKTIFPVWTKSGACEFRVWAPKAEKVSLIIEPSGEKYELQPETHGYFYIKTNDVSPGARYKYQINNGEKFPDPASLSQPDGVHEASEAIDLKDFKWHDLHWKNIPLEEIIQYELHTGTFTSKGTFDGIADKLDYLKNAGINTIEILPVSQFSGKRNWGYDGVYPFAVQNSYGGAKGLMDLIDKCHQNGMAVILDVVYNHFGPEGNYTGNFGHYFSDRYSTPWGQPINFDGPYSDGVRNYVIQNALMWCRDFHIDGLRLDAVHSIFDFSAKHIMRELAENLNGLSNETGREYYLIAESHLNDVRYISPAEKGGYGLQAQWSDDFHHAVHAITTGEKKGYYFDFGEPGQLSKAIKNAFVFDGKYSEFRKKTYGNSTENNSGKQFVVFTQNHDQVGNRLRGERLITLTDFETAKIAAATMFLAPNIPMLFMGEEYGERNPFLYFVSHLDANLNRLVREGRKKEFKDFYDNAEKATDPDSEEAFEKSKLSWDIENNMEKRAMLDFYRKLIRLRKNHPALKIPDKDKLSISDDGKLFAMKRWLGDNYLVAFINFEDGDKRVKAPAEISDHLNKLLDSEDSKWLGSGNLAPDRLQPGEEINIYKKSVVIYSN